MNFTGLLWVEQAFASFSLVLLHFIISRCLAFSVSKLSILTNILGKNIFCLASSYEQNDPRVTSLILFLEYFLNFHYGKGSGENEKEYYFSWRVVAES